MKRLVVTIAALGFAGALAAPAHAVDIHVNIVPPSFVFETPPHLVVVPGHPHVHYAPDVSVNFFSYGGRYYTYDGGNWFIAGDNRGPWSYVERGRVPVYVRNVPTRYYRVPPRHVGGGHWHGHGHGNQHENHEGGHHHGD